MSVEQLLPVEKLREAGGVGPTTISRLKETGYQTVQSVVSSPVRELIERAGLSHDVAEKVVDIARDLVSPGFITSDVLYERRKTAMRLTTGSRALDAMLAGGVETQAVTELAGEFASGKSQICMMLCASCQLPRERGGLESGALYIDTEGTFTPERVYSMAQGLGLDPTEALKRIIYARAWNSDHQMLIAERCDRIIEEKAIRLVIVDSIVSHFRGEYLGRESLAERQQRLNRHVHKLLRFAEVYNLAVVVTNQVLANPQAFFGDPNKPAGGNVLAHATTHRIYLRKCKGNMRHATVMDSPSLPPTEEPVAFQITAWGIKDVEEKQDRGRREEGQPEKQHADTPDENA